MVDTHRMADLFGAVGDARVVLVGDPRQVEAIGASGWYGPSVSDRGCVELTQVHRQEDRRDIAMLEDLGRQAAHLALDDL